MDKYFRAAVGLIGLCISIGADSIANVHLSSEAMTILRILCSAFGFTLFAAAFIPKLKTAHLLIYLLITFVPFGVLVFWNN